MKRSACWAIAAVALFVMTGCQHCCWTIFPDVAACGPSPGCGEIYWGDWRVSRDPCDKCGNWIGDCHSCVEYNKWGRRCDGGGCIPECQCGHCDGACTTCGGHDDCGCGVSQGNVVYSDESEGEVIYSN